MQKLATVYGGSGFVGRYVVQRLARAGWRVRVAVRRPNEALFVRTYGVPGQVEPVLCNVRDDVSVRAAMEGAEAVVNCVGILVEQGRNTFDAIHHLAAGRIARLAAECGVSRLVHVSAIGADEHSRSAYARSKAQGERAVLEHFTSAMILRPSVIFGQEDEFFNRFARMAVISPVVPLVGGKTRFQPVYVDDVAHAAAKGALGEAEGGLHELGGPDTDTLRGLVRMMLEEIQRRRLVINLPFWMGKIMGWGLDMAQKISLGLFVNRILTRDQVENLRHDNIADPSLPGLEALGIRPTGMEAVLPDYLWVYRPGGQYAAIKASLKKLRA